MGTLALLLSSIAWGVLHSLLASHTCKRLARQWLGESLYKRSFRLLYNLAAGLSILPVLYLLVRLPDQQVYSIPAPWLNLALIIQAGAFMLLVLSVIQTGLMSFIGVSQLFGIAENNQLVTSGLYRYVRHPIYFASLLFLWASPSMSLNRLTLWVVFTVYFVVGAWFEERKLLKDFGESYAAYQKQTPMLIPFLPRSIG